MGWIPGDPKGLLQVTQLSIITLGSSASNMSSGGTNHIQTIAIEMNLHLLFMEINIVFSPL
jgi:hypothetical protein